MQTIPADIARALSTLIAALRTILGDGFTLCLYGSVTLGDFHLGWSDIDLLCLTDAPIPDAAAETLVMLRQTLLAVEPDNPYYRTFEGAIAWRHDLLHAPACPAVYWGTSGQRRTDRYALDVFARKELIESGICLCGEDFRAALTMPTEAELRDAIVFHCDTIRRYAADTAGLYAWGWMLDIARCLYTLRTGGIIAKTAAGEWALREGLCPAPAVMAQTLAVRRSPTAPLPDCPALQPAIARFNALLAAELGL